MFNNMNTQCVSDDLTTWSLRDLNIERSANKRDAMNGFPDEAYLKRLLAEIKRREEAS